MSWSLIINGNTYTSANLAGFNYAQDATGLVAMFSDMLQHNLNSFRFSSTDTITYQTGLVDITIEENKPFITGTALELIDVADSNNYLRGNVRQYDSATGALTLEITSFNGIGDNDDWVGNMSMPSAESIQQVFTARDQSVAAAAQAQVIAAGNLDYKPAIDNYQLVNGDHLLSATTGDKSLVMPNTITFGNRFKLRAIDGRIALPVTSTITIEDGTKTLAYDADPAKSDVLWIDSASSKNYVELIAISANVLRIV